MSDRYAVIGNPIVQSKSPFIHTRFAEATRQDIVYEAIEGPLGGFAARVDQFRAEGGRGMNVTAPFKLDAFAYATDLSESARAGRGGELPEIRRRAGRRREFRWRRPCARHHRQSRGRHERATRAAARRGRGRAGGAAALPAPGAERVGSGQSHPRPRRSRWARNSRASGRSSSAATPDSPISPTATT